MQPSEIREVIERATRAPSIHNTQPWRFSATSYSIDLYAERSRAVPVIDPTGRQLYMSCGAAAEFAYLGIRAHDLDVTVTLLPEPGDPDHVARLHIGPHRPATPAEPSLVRAIARRHTDRAPYDDRPLPAGLVDAMRVGVESRGAWLREISDPGEVAVVAMLQGDADALENADPDYRAELASWLRASADAPDGIPLSMARGVRAGKRASSVRLREFADESGADAVSDAAPTEDPPPVERPALILLGSDRDDVRSWLRAGRALGWLLLRATVADVVASPLGQVTDLPDTRRALAHELHVTGHPQLLLRMGFGQGSRSTHRRSIDDVIVTA